MDEPIDEILNHPILNHQEDDDFEPWPERLALLERIAVEAARRLDRELMETPSLGFQGGSIGYPTTSGEWLSVRVTPLKGDDYRAVRERIRLADRIVPTSIPRPHEIASELFTVGDDSVFASLNPLAPGRACSRYPCLTEDDPLITEDYVRALRTHADTLARIQQAPPHSQTLHARFGAWVREECLVYTSLSIDRLVTGHGDFHWGNFRVPEPFIVDWEYWGKVPEGYDAAQLLVMSLAVPRIVELIREVFGDQLDTADGRRCQALWCHVVLLSRKYEGAFGRLAPAVQAFMVDELDVEPSHRELGGPPWEE
ncbi:MAG: hypothetical protein HYX32_10785 [Actinobacteria bacterium]|nr:hypothetical protein [Actinomycetota bacterium]